MFHRIAAAVFATFVAATAAMAQLQNASFELPGTTTTFANWQTFNNAPPEFSVAHTGAVSLKAYGNFTTAYNTSGGYQELPTTPGQSWQASVWAMNPTADPILGTNSAVLNIEWHAADGSLISFVSAAAANSASPAGVWHQATVTGTAPAGTANVRIVLLFVQGPELAGGSVLFDDAQLAPTTITGLQNPSFEEPGAATPFRAWTNFGNTFSDGQFVRTGTKAAKMFGNFSGPYNASGVFQDFPAQPGQRWLGGAWVGTITADRIGGSNFAAINIEWHDAANNLISFESTRAADAATTPNVFQFATVTGVAPAGTTSARIVLLHIQGPENAGGAVWFDDAAFGLAGPVCGTADFNGDGDVGTDQDIEAFFRCLAGTCCASCFSGGADFNADGDVGTDQDIEAFFRVLAGNPC